MSACGQARGVTPLGFFLHGYFLHGYFLDGFFLHGFPPLGSPAKGAPVSPAPRVLLAAGVLLSLSLLIGCNSFAPPPEQLLRSISDPPTARLRAKMHVAVESNDDPTDLQGKFEGVLVVSPGRFPSLRLQLFPDVGSKVLDLAIDSERTTVFHPGTPRSWPNDQIPRQQLLGRGSSATSRNKDTLLALLAITLQQHIAPLRSRLDAARRVSDASWELRLSPHPSGVETRVLFCRDQEQLRRHYYSWRSWESRGTLAVDSVLRIASSSFALELRIDELDHPERIPSQLFRLRP